MRPDLFVNVLLPSRVPSNPRLPVLLLCVVVAGSRPREACVALFPSHHANIHEKYHRLDALVYTDYNTQQACRTPEPSDTAFTAR